MKKSFKRLLSCIFIITFFLVGMCLDMARVNIPEVDSFSVSEGSGVANTLASDVEKEFTSGIFTRALSRHMPIRKNVITNMQLNSLLKLFFIRTSPF
jgi:hypothetical protein